MTGPTDSGHSRTTVTTKFSDPEKHRINEIAYEKSEPGKDVTASDVVREAVRDYVEKYEDTPEECSPGERGCIEIERVEA